MLLATILSSVPSMAWYSTLLFIFLILITTLFSQIVGMKSKEHMGNNGKAVKSIENWCDKKRLAIVAFYG